jgi:hypothetical protein
MALARPCLGCGRLVKSTSRCSACQLRRPRGRQWQAIRRRVFARYGKVCHVCGEPATDMDHLIPIAAGGTDELSNLGRRAPAATGAGAKATVTNMSLCMESTRCAFTAIPARPGE